jgi:hypothetical protein
MAEDAHQSAGSSLVAAVEEPRGWGTSRREDQSMDESAVDALRFCEVKKIREQVGG